MTRTFAALALAVTLALAGCSSTPAREDRPTIVPAQPAAAPEPTVAPAGTVVPSSAGEGLAFDPKTRRLAALVGNDVVVYTVDGGLKEVAKVSLDGRGNQVIARDNGGFVVAVKDRVAAISPDDPTVLSSVATGIKGGDVLTVANYPAGGGNRLLVGTADGDVVDVSGTDHKTIKGPVEASRLLVRDDHVAVVDRRQASITEIDVPGGKAGKSLRVGRGITNAAIDPFGRIFAVDTGQNQLVGYTISPFMERFLYPVAGSPWAVDYDDSAKLVWVTQTATNSVVGYALGSGMPEQKKQYPTVRQPNAIAVDAKTGTLFVQSASGGGIQAIPTR